MRSYCSLQTRGSRVQLCSSGSPTAAAKTTDMPQEMERRQQALLSESNPYQSCFLLSISTPLPSSLHWAQHPPAPPALRAPATNPLGQKVTHTPSNPTGKKTGLSPSCAPLGTTQTLSPPAAPAPMDSEIWQFWI